MLSSPPISLEYVDLGFGASGAGFEARKRSVRLAFVVCGVGLDAAYFAGSGRGREPVCCFGIRGASDGVGSGKGRGDFDGCGAGAVSSPED